MKSRCEASFRIRGKGFSPEEVSSYLSINCTEDFDWKETNIIEGKDAAFTAWVISIKDDDGDDDHISVHTLVSLLIKSLEPVQIKIIELIDKYDLSVDFSIDVAIEPRDYRQVLYNEEPLTDFRLEPKELDFLSKVGATVYIDTGYYEWR